MLVYCFRGGKRSRLWADNLRTIGFEVDVLAGGWKRYRAWVRSSLETEPARFTYRVLCGPTGCGKTRLLHALREAGEQVLDLEGLASHRGSLIGGLPGQPQPSQKLFDSRLLDTLRAFDVQRPVWIEAESKKIGRIQLPDALHEAMYSSPTLTIAAPMAERVRLWHEDYAHFAADPAAMVEQLSPLKPLIGGEELTLWRTLAAERHTAELFERVMVAHYDPAYTRSTRRLFANEQGGERLELPSLAPDALRAVALQLLPR
jgi:tRNA 2-selenouridine synthase